MTAPASGPLIIWLALPAGRPAYILLAAGRAEAGQAAGEITPGADLAELWYATGYLARPVTGRRVPQPRRGAALAGSVSLFHVAAGAREFRVLAAGADAAQDAAAAILGTETAITVSCQGGAPEFLAEAAEVLAARFTPETIGA